VRDRLVARVDLKAERKNGALLVRSAHFEPGVDRPETEIALRDELGRLAEWLELESIVYG
jgi:uncharacterized protein YcaQ